MKIFKAAIIGLGPSGLAVNKIIYDDNQSEIIAFENTNINERNNFFGFWLTDWMRPYESLIEKKWSNWIIGNPEMQINHNDKVNPYCVISYKNWKKYCLNTSNNLVIKNKKVTSYHPIDNYFKIITEDNEEFFAEKIYDSRYIKYKKNELSQNFYGINLLTDDHTFDSNKATLMQFTQEENILHFIYVLPFSHNKALIESTVFSKEIMKEDWYRGKINNYLRVNNINKLREESFEKGIIPMFFAEEQPNKNQNVFNIGIRGGACKPSTGYAFSFLIKQIQLFKKSKKNYVTVHNFLERNMDRIFLNYLKKYNEDGRSFIKIASELSGYEFQSFMMGKSSLNTKLKIIKSMPKLPFIRSILN